MANDYVLLVTNPKPEKFKPGPGGISPVGPIGELDPDDDDVKAALALLVDKSPPTPNANNGSVDMYEPGDTDGGNGSGGDGFNGLPLRARWGYQRKSYWNFRVCPSAIEPDEVRFPPQLRIEACVYFSHLRSAREFLVHTTDGVSNKTKLERVFQHVLLVAVTDHN